MWTRLLSDTTWYKQIARRLVLSSRQRGVHRTAIAQVLLLTAFASVAQASAPYVPHPADPLLESFRWHRIPELTEKGFRCMAEGRDGVMWFGVEKGVLSYDGTRWNSFDCDQVDQGPTLSIAVASDGKVFATDERAVWQLHGGKCKRVFPGTRDRQWGIYKLTISPNGDLWIGTNHGVLRIHDGKSILYGAKSSLEALRDASQHAELRAIPGLTSPDHMFPVYDIEPGGVGELLVRGRDGVYSFTYDDTGLQSDSWRELSDLKKNWQPLRSTVVCQAADGAVWALGDNGIVIRIKDEATESWDLWKLMSGDVTVSIASGDDGSIWVGGQGSLFIYRDGEWKSYAQPQIPCGGAARITVLPASDGAVWVASEQNDVYRVDYSSKRWLSLEDLNFFAEAADGRLWFLDRDGRAVSANRQLDHWQSYGPEDGLIETPVTLFMTRGGQVWAAGSHGQKSAVSYLDGKQWRTRVIRDHSWSVDYRSVFEARDGSLWFGAAANALEQRGDRGGVVRYDPKLGPFESDAAWSAVKLPEPLTSTYGIGQTADGRMWFGGRELYAFDAKSGKRIKDLPTPFPVDARIDNLHTTPDGRLWVATRNYGIASCDGKKWKRFDASNGLLHNTIIEARELASGDVLIGTDRDVSRFDGVSWASRALPESFNLQREGGEFRQTSDGAIWISIASRDWKRRALERGQAATTKQDFRTRRYRPQPTPPVTSISLYEPEVSSRGNTIIAWTGADRWHSTDHDELRYSYRFDKGEWSPFTTETQRAFTSLDSGVHTFEVRARDMDFNVDPKPPAIEFHVAPPIWRQPWFIGLMGLLTAAAVVGIRAIHVHRWNQALQEVNLELERRVALRTSELEESNRELEAFANSVSHDLRTPLRAMEGFAVALEEDYGNKLDDQGRGFLRHITDAASRMDTLIHDLLNYSRLGRMKLQLQSISLDETVRSVLEELALEISASGAQVSVDDRLHSVRGQRAMLTQVITNLISNAIKFVGAGVRPEVKVWTELVATGRVRLNVQDNGIGIEPRQQTRIFSMFERLHGVERYPGTGIGLAIVARGCERLGGKCGVDSVPGNGSRFWIELPAGDPNAETTGQSNGKLMAKPTADHNGATNSNELQTESLT